MGLLPSLLTVLVNEKTNADAHEIESVEEVLNATLDVVERSVRSCCRLLHLHQSMCHRLNHRQVPALYLIQSLRKTTHQSNNQPASQSVK